MLKQKVEVRERVKIGSIKECLTTVIKTHLPSIVVQQKWEPILT